MSWCGLCFVFRHFSKISLWNVPAFPIVPLGSKDTRHGSGAIPSCGFF